MFEKLKEKLGSLKKTLGGVLEETEKEAIKTEPSKPIEVKKDVEKIGIFGKLKVAVLEQEFIIGEDSLKDHLWELEVALLESDVSLPVAEKIVESVNTE